MFFFDVVGHEDAKLALILNAIDPNCGGALFAGEKGTGKSTLARRMKNLLPAGRPFVNLPLNATEDALLGGVDLEEAIREGRDIRREGLFRKAEGGILYIDDVNLLPPEIAALVLKAQGGADHAASGEGPENSRLLRFQLLASMNPEEGLLSPHLLDRFGMCVPWEGLKEPSLKMAVMKTALLAGEATNSAKKRHLRLHEQMQAARLALVDTVVSTEMREAIARACIENDVAGHRGDIFLYYAARAYAAFQGERDVTPRHVDTVLPLVLLHRKRIREQMREDETQKQHHHEKPSDEKGGRERDRESGDDAPRNREDVEDDRGREDSGQTHGRPRESNQAEEIFDIGEDFKLRRLTFRKDRIPRAIAGRRTKTGSLGKRGRYIKNILKPNNDIALDATIRAAAPHQIARGRKDRLLIRDEDLRYKKREKRMGHLVVLVVDGSGSMGAQKRMIETKGAVQSLLLDCYQKRDRVALVIFRKDRADVILPPTSSVETASRMLREIPVGGKTPLTAGLLTAYNLVRQVRMRTPETRFLVVLVTDGRANQSVSGMPVREEIPKMAGLLGELPSTDYIVIDTEDKKTFTKADLAPEIAAMLGADYYRIDDLKADCLTEIVRDRKKRNIE